MNHQLNDIVRSYCLRKNDPNLNRFARFRELACNILVELAIDVSAEPYSVQLPVDKIGECNIPENFINYISISIVGANGELWGLSKNNFINTTQYWTDCGKPIRENQNAFNTEGTFYAGWYGAPDFLSHHWSRGENIGAYFNCPAINPNGTYKFDFNRNKIILSGVGNLGQNSIAEAGTTEIANSVVLEYIADLQTFQGDYQIHPFIIETIKKGIVYLDMEGDRNYSEGAKQRAKLNYELERKHSVHRFSTATREEIINSMRKRNHAIPAW